MNINARYRSKKDGNFIVFLDDKSSQIIWYAFKHKIKGIWCSYYNEERPELIKEKDVYDYFDNSIVPLYEAGKPIDHISSTKRHDQMPIELILELHLKLHNS